MSQGDVAQKIGTTQSVFSRWEKPDYGSYTLKKLQQIADVLGVVLWVDFISYAEFRGRIEAENAWIPVPSEGKDMTVDELVEAMARAMKKRAAEPVANIPSLEPILVGSLGDAWPYLMRAALAAVEATGKWRVVPVEPDDAMVEAGFYCSEHEERPAVRATYVAMLAAAPKVTP